MLALASRFLPSPGPRLRTALFGGLRNLVTIVLLLLWFANVEFFSSWDAFCWSSSL